MTLQQAIEYRDSHPINSPFWDSPRGQQALEILEAAGSNTYPGPRGCEDDEPEGERW